MEMIDLLLGLSWVFSMVMCLAIGFGVAMAMVQKQKAAVWDRALNFMEGLKNDYWSSKDGGSTAATTEEE